MPISLELHPELISKLINCPVKGKYRNLDEDDCCNNCMQAESILSVEKVPVGLYCLRKKRVVAYGELCSRFDEIPF